LSLSHCVGHFDIQHLLRGVHKKIQKTKFCCCLSWSDAACFSCNDMDSRTRAQLRNNQPQTQTSQFFVFLSFGLNVVILQPPALHGMRGCSSRCRWRCCQGMRRYSHCFVLLFSKCFNVRLWGFPITDIACVVYVAKHNSNKVTSGW
jgi:hypothetical protein